MDFVLRKKLNKCYYYYRLFIIIIFVLDINLYKVLQTLV